MQQIQHQQQSYENVYTKTILIVEDDDGIGQLLVEVLSMETSYHTVLMSNGQQALNFIQMMKPSLVITDYRLPVMNGIELYDRVHAYAELSDVPTILMSAYMPEAEIHPRQIETLRKPFELDELLDIVERLLRHK